VAAGVAAHASSSSSHNAGKTRPAGWDLQFDECALLVQHCSNLGPVLKAVADWAATRSPKDADVRVLVAALTKHFANEVAAARRSKQSGSSSKVVSDGPWRRTLLPPIAPYGVLSLDGLNRQVDGRIDTFFQSESISKLTADLQAAAVQLVCGAAMQVVCDLRLKEGSAVLETLLQTAMFSGGWSAVLTGVMDGFSGTQITFFIFIHHIRDGLSRTLTQQLYSTVQKVNAGQCCFHLSQHWQVHAVLVATMTWRALTAQTATLINLGSTNFAVYANCIINT
jgi:hypothetical protein